jgi:hypothetical protein
MSKPMWSWKMSSRPRAAQPGRSVCAHQVYSTEVTGMPVR